PPFGSIALKSLSLRIGRWISGQAYLLLALTALLWGGNGVAGKLAVNEISPMALTCLRWLVACLALALLVRRDLAAQWRLLIPHWRSVALMGTCGYTIFSALFFLAAYHTSAVNLTILQGSIPVLVLIASFAIFGTPVSWITIIGMAATLVGVAVAA